MYPHFFTTRAAGRSSSIKRENMVMGKCGRCSNNSGPSKYGTVLQYIVVQPFFFMGQAQSHFLNAFISFVMESLHHFLTLATSFFLNSKKTLWSEEKNSSFSLFPSFHLSFVHCTQWITYYNRVSKQDGCQLSVLPCEKENYPIQSRSQTVK